MPYTISDNTKAKLQALIDGGPGPSLGHGGVGGTRQVIHVKVTGDKDEEKGRWPCKATAYNPVDEAWVEYDGTAYVYEANDADLEVDKRYTAIRYGITEAGEYIFVTDIGLPDLGCGLWRNDDEELAVYTPDMAGQGLNYDPTYCQLYIDPGCGITLEGGKKVGVHADTLAGYGLVRREICRIDVNPGCGLTLDMDADTVKVYTPDMAGQGLNPSADGCQLYIDPGCGITLEGGKKVGVHADTLAGSGLVKEGLCSLAVNPGCGIAVAEDKVKVYTPDMAGQGLNYDPTYCQLYIDPGCGITLEGGKKVGVHADSLAGTCLVKEGTCALGVDMTEVTGPTFSAVTAVSLSGNCYGISLGWTTTAFGFMTNPCGLFLGFEAVSSFSGSSYVPLGCCCPPTTCVYDCGPYYTVPAPEAEEETVSAQSIPAPSEAIDASKADVPAVWNRSDWITPKPLPPLAGIEPKSRYAVVTCAVGEKGRQLLELSEPGLRAYAHRVGADFHVIGGDAPLNPLYPMEDKFRIGQFFDHYDRIAYIDADVLVRPDAPDLFDLVPLNAVALHDDLPHNTGGYAWFYNEVEHVQRWQGMRLRPLPWCLNTGLIVVSKAHRVIFDPPTRPYQAIHCFEQHLINCRIAEAGIPVFLLPTAVHWQWWLDKKRTIYPKSQFVHFAGLLDHAERLRQMRETLAELGGLAA